MAQQVIWPPKIPRRYHLLGLLLFFLAFFTTLFGSVVVVLPYVLFLKPVSKKGFYYVLEFMFNSWFLFNTFCREKLGGLSFVVTGDEIPPGESALAISNHPSEADWLYFSSFTARWHTGPGWAIDSFGYLFVSRNWKKDKFQMRFSLNEYLQKPTPFVLFLFPEGTDFSPMKLERSLKWARESGIAHEYEHTLVPRVKGFVTAVNSLRGKVSFVYDFTFAYEGGVTPSLWSAWCGWFPKKAFVHVRKFAMDELPVEKKDLAEWCYQCFAQKNQLIARFRKEGKFPSDKKPSWPKVKYDTMSFFAWVLLVVFSFYYFVTSPWFRMIQVSGWIFYFVSSFYEPLRIWRGLQPPPLDSIKKKQ